MYVSDLSFMLATALTVFLSHIGLPKDMKYQLKALLLLHVFYCETQFSSEFLLENLTKHL